MHRLKLSEDSKFRICRKQLYMYHDIPHLSGNGGWEGGVGMGVEGREGGWEGWGGRQGLNAAGALVYPVLSGMN